MRERRSLDDIAGSGLGAAAGGHRVVRIQSTKGHTLVRRSRKLGNFREIAYAVVEGTGADYG